MMKSLLVLVVLFSFGGTSSDGYGGEKDQEINEEDIRRPCSYNDWECIRHFLASNSKCKPAYGPVPDPLLLPVDKFYIPSINITLTHTDLEIRGLRSGKITEFYINKVTGNVVIAINVQRLNQTSPRTFFSYQRTAKEPIILSDFTTVTYDSATFTAVIPKAPHLRLDRADIHADIHDGRPVYAVGPRAGKSADPDVTAAFAEFIATIPTIIQEAFVFQSSVLTAIYIETYLCDFGLSAYRNYLRFVGTKGYTQVPSYDHLDGKQVYISNDIVRPISYPPTITYKALGV